MTTNRRPGRPTRGVDRIDDFDSSSVAKERAKALLLAVAGDGTITTHLESLGICRTRFVKLRDRALRAFVEALEPRVSGRAAAAAAAASTDPAALELQRLRDEAALLKWELEAAQIREVVLCHFPDLAADRRRGERDGR
jgi:hypothetical protein